MVPSEDLVKIRELVQQTVAVEDRFHKAVFEMSEELRAIRKGLAELGVKTEFEQLVQVRQQASRELELDIGI